MDFLLHHLLRRSADRNPGGSAIRFGEKCLTYAELEAQSNQLARALVEAKVRPGDRVGIHVEKSLASIVSVFAVLKAGASYVPLDVRAPSRRVGQIVERCGMRCLIGSPVSLKKFPGDWWTTSPLQSVFCTDSAVQIDLPARVQYFQFSQVIAPQSVSPLDIRRIDQDLAYILFTSGSTGEPKGVMLSHRNALAFVDWAHEVFGIRADDHLSNHAPLSFDLSVFDIFGGIRAGASVTLVPEELSIFPLKLSKFIEEQRLTVWYSVPSVLTLLLTRGQLANCDLHRLRLILFAGEVFPMKYLRKLCEIAPHVRLFNLYGPTETNVCTYYEVESTPGEQELRIPIGKACANTEVVAFDETGKVVGSPGEEGLLYVRGPTVMQGYYGLANETERAFVQNPFSPGRREMLYCTGDVVTLDPSGNYYLIGRKDHLVKSRGYRIELGEIESVLHRHPAVREAAVAAIPDELLGNRIKAFLVIEGPRSLDEQTVKQHCAHFLPGYMVPEEVEFRSSLPLTTTGKVDRQRLGQREYLKS